jgi:two-component system, sensor histidine kinase and response regulator
MYKKQMVLLLIEDNPGDVRLVQRLLAATTHNSFRLIIAGRLAEGLIHLNRGKIDVVLLDLSLPDSRGMETATTILAQAGNVPVVVFTGLYDEELGMAAVRAGAQDYLVKGDVDALLLSRALRYAVERQQLIVERDRLIADLDAFAHTVAHDLKTPLGAILGYSDLLRATAGSPATVEPYVQKIEQATYRMNDLIQELLLLASVRQNPVMVEPFNMGSVVGKALARVEHLVEEYQAEVIRPAYWPPAIGYAPWVETVWVNYLVNAIKYGGRPPRIELGSDVRINGAVCYWVRDNGTGIEPAAQGHLFQPFSRLGHLPVEGHGLGLAIVQRIIEKLGGRVGLESAPGQGATFYFTLPGVFATSFPEPYWQPVPTYAEVT